MQDFLLRGGEGMLKFLSCSGVVRVSSRKLCRGGKFSHYSEKWQDQMKNRHGFYSILGYYEGVVEEFGWGGNLKG